MTGMTSEQVAANDRYEMEHHIGIGDPHYHQFLAVYGCFVVLMFAALIIAVWRTERRSSVNPQGDPK